jgi:endonuclease YncB( thermonuclease family)
MSYTLIEGTFRAIGFSPDGDSVRFAPLNVDLINVLPGAKTTLLPGKSIQLRLECIDALETHYTSGSPRLTHQPMKLAMAARERLLYLLGFRDVVWSNDLKTVVACTADDRPGFILSNGFDSYGTRPVAYAFPGALPAGSVDGQDVFLTSPRLVESVNYAMVGDGYAYPMYYEGAFHDLRATFDAAVAAARTAARADGVWATDVTSAGFVVPPPQNLTEISALWPKLFRRVSTFFKENPEAELDEFPAWLAANRDPCLDLDTGSWTALHNFVVWQGGTIQLTKDITRLLFQG